jgi:hypothetical protein
MPILIDKHKWLPLLQQLSPFEVKTLMALLTQMEPELSVRLSMGTLSTLTQISPLTLRKCLDRLASLNLILIQKRERGPGAKLHLIVHPSVGVNTAVLMKPLTDFSDLKKVVHTLWELQRRSLLSGEPHEKD